jgi:hypothetical protein
MRLPKSSYVALGALVAALGCGKSMDTMAKPDESAVANDTTQNTSGYQGQQRDTSMTTADSTGNQTKSGVTDSSGTSTLGPGATRTRPDQGQPVTSKGDTINPGVDSSTRNQSAPGATVTTDSSNSSSSMDTTSSYNGTSSSPSDSTGSMTDTTSSSSGAGTTATDSTSR